MQPNNSPPTLKDNLKVWNASMKCGTKNLSHKLRQQRNIRNMLGASAYCPPMQSWIIALARSLQPRRGWLQDFPSCGLCSCTGSQEVSYKHRRYRCGCDSCGVYSSSPHRGTVDYIRHWKTLPYHTSLCSSFRPWGVEIKRLVILACLQWVWHSVLFCWKRQETSWDVRMAFPGVNAAFSASATPVEDISDSNMALL